MPQASKQVTIDGKVYEIFHIPPTAALKNYLKLQKLLLGPLGEALNSANVGGSNIMEVLERNIDLGSALGKLAESINPEELTGLFKELIELGAQCKGPIQFEIQFLGNIGEVFAVVKEVISFNYPNFFGILFGLIDFGKLQDSTRAPSTSIP